MSRRELVEWILILLIIIAWWPRVFLGYDPLWYHILIYYLAPVVLILIFVRRFRAMQEGFDYSERMMKAQRPTQTLDSGLSDQKQQSPPSSPLPFMAPPEEDDDSD